MSIIFNFKSFKIKILQYYDDEIRIQGDLDLDTDQETTSVLIILKNNNATFKGSGIFEEYSDKTENIKIVLAPLNYVLIVGSK